MAARERKESLVGRRAVGEIGLEHALDRARRIVGLQIAIDLAAALGVRPEAAADVDVIALDLIAVLRHKDLSADEADVADVVLRARIRAAGEMNVERAVELHALLAPARDVLGIALGVGQREPATGIASA